MSRASVLLVDDRPENLLALRAVLEPLDCATVSVRSGEEALKALLQDEFAVVLLDVQMPGMDGFETAELIKQRERTRAVPIIFVTAISKERHHVFRGYSAGAVDYLFKPYDPGVLRSKVQVFLELDAKSRAAAESAALLRATFASAPAGLARLDLEGRIAEVNRALAELLGYEPAELRDRLLESLVEALAKRGGDRDWRTVLASGRAPAPVPEALLRAKDGREIPCLLTFSQADPGAGVPSSLVVGVQDLRERRRAQEEREQRVREQVARSQAERLSEHHRALQSISDAAVGNLAFDALVGELLKATAAALAVDAASAVLDEPDGRSTVHRVVGGVDGRGPGEHRWYSVVSGQSDGAAGDGMAATLSVPLAVDGQAIGALVVGTLFPREFTGAEEMLLRLAADRAALGIQRARLFERERTIAEELQRSLLPAQLPELPGLRAAARHFPAGAQVGGDWYDALVTPDGNLLLVMGDVAGRGIKAASIMGQLRSALRAYALDGHGPGAILDRLSTFQAGMPGRDIATIGLVSVEASARGGREIRFANAGHPPALLVDAAGEPTWLRDALGPPIGAVEDAVHVERSLQVDRGATLVLYTDGLVERRREPLDHGLARLEASVVAGARDIDALCEQILARTQADKVSEDDVTVLVLQTAGARRRRPATPDPFPAHRADAAARQLATGTWPHVTTRTARVELAGGPRAGAAARQAVVSTFEPALNETELSDLRNVVAEVVNNAVVHGGAGAEGEVVTVYLAAAPEAVRVEVCSAGRAFEPRTPPPREEPGGFGLVIVDKLTSRWGTDFNGDVCVWFELDRA